MVLWLAAVIVSSILLALSIARYINDSDKDSRFAAMAVSLILILVSIIGLVMNVNDTEASYDIKSVETYDIRNTSTGETKTVYRVSIELQKNNETAIYFSEDDDFDKTETTIKISRNEITKRKDISSVLNKKAAE